MNVIRRSLFLQFYLTVLASLALVATLIIIMAGIGRFDPHDQLSDRVGNFIGAILPPADNLGELTSSVHRISLATGADISVYDTNGNLLAAAGPPIPASTQPEDPKGFGPPPRTIALDTPQGLHVVARARSPFGPMRRNIAFFVLLTAGTLGLAAYPITRHLTRRLKRLKVGMNVWSAGALQSRVAVEGDDEIADVARTFNLAASRIEELVTAQRSLLANASHELRSPLARLRMATEMYQITPGDRLKAEIVGNLRELDELVEEILLMSRLESRQPEELADDCDLLSIAAEEAARAGAAVSGQSIIIKGNAKLLRRLVRNLVQNAARHGKPPVEVDLSRSGNLVRLSVRDHGPGLTTSEADRVFEPFYRPTGHGESAGGWGLGLALVRQIAELHGGRAFYEPPTDGGARFVAEFHIKNGA
jgi:two-component system, OmpR family, sensor kinase